MTTCPSCGQPVPTQDLAVDTTASEVVIGDTRVRVAPQLADFINALAERRGKPLHVERLAVRIWGYDNTPEGYRNVLNVYACRARKILKPYGYGITYAGRMREPTLTLARIPSTETSHDGQVQTQVL